MARAEKERSFGLWDAKGGNSGCENATRPHLPNPDRNPGSPWRRRRAQASGGPQTCRPERGPRRAPPPGRRSLRRRRLLGPYGRSPRRGHPCQRRQPAGRALSLTAPNPQLQLGLVQVLHIVPQEAVQQVCDYRLQHHGGPEAAGPGGGRTQTQPRAATRAANDSPSGAGPPPRRA